MRTAAANLLIGLALAAVILWALFFLGYDISFLDEVEDIW